MELLIRKIITQKKIISILFSISSLILFLKIKISYNGNEPTFLYHGLGQTFCAVMKHGFYLSLEHYDLNFGARLVEISLMYSFLILASVFYKKFFLYFFQIIILSYWYIIALINASYIDLKLYYISSIPFVISVLIFIIYTFFNGKFGNKMISN